MQTTDVSVVGADQRDRVAGTLIAAFIEDPMIRYLWPEAATYLRSFPLMIDGFGGGAFAHDGADATDDFAGAALWLPPDVNPDIETLVALILSSVVETKHGDLFPVLEQMAAAHPEETHWHLAFIGTDAAHQGRGIGAALLRDRLAKIDALGHHAYLESSNPRNIAFYQRHGFEVTGEIQVGDSPMMIPMVRPPR